MFYFIINVTVRNPHFILSHLIHFFFLTLKGRSVFTSVNSFTYIGARETLLASYLPKEDDDAAAHHSVTSLLDFLLI